MNNEYIKKITWRYAVKKFDPSKKLSDEQLSLVLEAGRLAPSSFGLQAWKIAVIKDPEIRKKLKDAAFGQTQVTDASHLLVLCIRKNIGEQFVDHYINTIAKERGVNISSLSGFKEGMLNSFLQKTEEEKDEWSTRQVYIMLGFILSACAENGIDACPMEGFDPKKFDEILKLKLDGFESRVLCALGFRSENDEFEKMKKVRFPKEEIITEI